MPDLQRVTLHQEEYDDCYQPGCQVTDHHGQLAIPPVNPNACERAEDDPWYVGEEDHAGECGCLPGLLIQPDSDGERKQSSSDQGHNLTDPNDGKSRHTSKMWKAHFVS